MIEISDLTGYYSFGTFYWQIETAMGFNIYPLTGRNDFDFTHGAGVEYAVRDITGDGIAEVLTFHSHQPGGPGFLYSDLEVFDLSQYPPRKLSFSPDGDTAKYISYYLEFSVVESNGMPVGISIKSKHYSYCSGSVYERYDWDGQGLEFIQTDYEIGEPPYCIYLIHFFSDGPNRYNYKAEIELIKALLTLVSANWR